MSVERLDILEVCLEPGGPHLDEERQCVGRAEALQQAHCCQGRRMRLRALRILMIITTHQRLRTTM